MKQITCLEGFGGYKNKPNMQSGGLTPDEIIIVGTFTSFGL